MIEKISVLTVTNRTFAAIREPYNVWGLTTVAALTVGTFSPLPLLLGVVAEAAYLIYVPDSSWYAAHLSRRQQAEVLAQRHELRVRNLPLLREEIQHRFIRLEEMRREIDQRSASNVTWMREVLRKLDFLLEKFLHFGVREEQFRTYLSEVRQEIQENQVPKTGPRLIPIPRAASTTADRKPQSALSRDEAWLRETIAVIQTAYDRELATVENNYANETDGSTRAILGKRLEVLRRRREFIGKIHKIVSNLNHQLSLVEDTFGLISDELLARDPEQVLADIEDVVSQTNTMTQVLEEMAPYERMLGRLG